MTANQKEARPERIGAGTPPSSQQIAWFECHQFLQALLEHANVGPLPAAGTPAWCELPDADPRKLIALAEAGVHHALRLDAEQTAKAQASRDISASANWRSIGTQIHAGRGAAYIHRRAS